MWMVWSLSDISSNYPVPVCGVARLDRTGPVTSRPELDCSLLSAASAQLSGDPGTEQSCRASPPPRHGEYLQTKLGLSEAQRVAL